MNQSSSAIEILSQHARGEVQHLNRGLCPDGVEGALTRDDECPVCQALQALTGQSSGELRVTVSLSMSKARELGLLNLQPGVHAICEGDLIDRFSLLIDSATEGAKGEGVSSLWVRVDQNGSPMLGTARHDKPTYERWEDHNWVMLSSAQPEIPEEIHAIARLVATQDNRMTDRPIFAVLEKREMVTLETHDHDRIVWIDVDSGDYQEASPQKARNLEKKFQACDETPGWERYAVKEVDQFVTACFTEEGCKEYLRKNGHNLRKPYIYAFGSHRNTEWRELLNFFNVITPQPSLSAAPAT